MAKISMDNLNSLKSNFLEQAEPKKKKFKKDERFITVTRDENDCGSIILRFVPDSDLRTAIKKYSHFGTLEVNGTTRRFIAECPTSKGEDCPYCSEYLDGWQNKDEAKTSILKSGKRKEYFVSNVLVVNDPGNPENNGKVMLYRYTYMINKMMVEAMKGDEATGEAPIDIFHPVNGANFVLKYSPQGKQTSLQGSKFLPPSSVVKTEEELNELLEKTYSLTEYENSLEYKSYDKLKAEFVYYYTGQRLTNSDS